MNTHQIIDLVLQKAKAGLRAEVVRGYLGMLWWVIEPVMYMAVFYVAFAHLMHQGDENYIVFLLTGLIVWKWFQATINTGANSLMNNKGLMNQVYLPKIIFPLTNIAVNSFKFFIILLLFLIFIQFFRHHPTLSWGLLPVLVLSQLLLITSVTCFCASLMPFFPDMRFILDNILMMFFFLSGIFFDITQLPISVQKYFQLNPMAVLIKLYRQIILENQLPDWRQLLYVILFSLIFLLMAKVAFRKFDRVYPKIIY